MKKSIQRKNTKVKKVTPTKTKRNHIVRKNKSDEDKILADIKQKEEKQKKEEEKKLKLQKRRSEIYKDQNNPNNFYVTNKGLMDELIKWRDSNEDVDKRVISDNFATMFLQIAYRLTNHSYFRNYTKELKEDMVSYASEKFVTGVKNYNFKFKNPFAYFTQSCFNSFKTVLSKNYKQINIKRALTKKMMVEIESEMPGSGIKKSLDNRFANDDYIDYD